MLQRYIWQVFDAPTSSVESKNESHLRIKVDTTGGTVVRRTFPAHMARVLLTLKRSGWFKPWWHQDNKYAMITWAKRFIDWIPKIFCGAGSLFGYCTKSQVFPESLEKHFGCQRQMNGTQWWRVFKRTPRLFEFELTLQISCAEEVNERMKRIIKVKN